MLTLNTVRKALWNYGSSVPYSTASPTDISEFDFKVNQVTERFFSLGTWRAMWKRPTLKVFGNTITLPRGFDTCRGAEVARCVPMPIYSTFHQFAANGLASCDCGCSGSGLQLLNESAQTFVIPTGTFTLKVVPASTESSGEMRLVGGFDDDDNEILETVTLDLTLAEDETTQQYVKLPEIQKDTTDGAIYLYSVDTDTSEETLIAVYAPGETFPSYRQYSISGVADETLVAAVCKLGFAPAISDEDVVIPGNMGALKLGLQAREFEDNVDPVNAGLYWGPNYPERTGKMAGAIDLLDAEAGELDAAEQPAMFVSQNFGAGAVYNVM